MNKDLNKEVETLRPFTRFLMTIGELPTSYLMSMTYYEQIIWFTKYLQEKVLPAINNNAEAVKEIQDYLNNLDLQDEVDNKLDEMADDGTLQEIITDYLNSKAIFAFDNVTGMQEATNLINGSYAKTLGFYNKGDFGESLYKIREITNEDVIDNFSIIPIGESNLIAELILEDVMNLTQLGVHQDNSTDDSDLLQNAINFASSKDIELRGTNNPIILTKSIYIPYNVKISNVYFKTSSEASNFTSSYMIGINTNNMSSWTSTYPNALKGFLKKCTIENTNQNNSINGIYNFANNLFEDIHFIRLNINFKTHGDYLDTVRMKGFSVDRKIGSDYALQLGYLGDRCVLDSSHMYGTIGDANFINVGEGHNPIELKNIIANGKISITSSLVNLTNIHSEYTTDCQIEIDKAQVNLKNAYLWHVDASNKNNIMITNGASVTLENVYFCYFQTNSYQNSSDNDINVSNDTMLTLINCYKLNTKNGSINTKNRSSVKTNLDTQGSLKQIKNYFNGSNQIKFNNTSSFIYGSLSAEYFNTIGDAKWFLPSGTYYYLFTSLVDNVRLIGTSYTRKGNISLTNNSNGGTAVISKSLWRVYRGTEDDSYDSYVDLAMVDGRFIDNGYMANGNLWKSRTAGDKDTINGGFNSVIQLDNGNVECTLNGAMPSVGTWKTGDIIHNISSSYKGTYICSSGGTPGTWIKL